MSMIELGRFEDYPVEEMTDQGNNETGNGNGSNA
jgi:hypothetical protein